MKKKAQAGNDSSNLPQNLCMQGKICSHHSCPYGIAFWLSARLVIERFRVRIPAGAGKEFSSLELTFCADCYSVSVPPRVTAVARKRPHTHSVKSAGGKLHLITHTPLTQRRRGVLTLLPGIVREPVRETSSHATLQGTLDYRRLSSLSCCGPILA